MVIIAKWLLKVGIGPVRAICTNCAFQSMISVQAAPRFAGLYALRSAPLCEVSLLISTSLAMDPVSRTLHH